MLSAWFALSALAAPLELPVGPRDEVEVVPAGERGLVVYVARGGDKDHLELLGYDAALAPTWTAPVDLGRRTVHADFDADRRYAWALRSERRRTRQVLRTDLDTGETQVLSVPLQGKVSPRAWIRADGAGGAWVADQGLRRGSLVWVGPDAEVHPVPLERDALVIDLAADAGGVRASLRARKVDDDTPLALVSVDRGVAGPPREVRGTGEERLLSGQVLPIAFGGPAMVVGTYGRGARAADGMYVAKFDAAGAQQGFVKHPFAGFEGLREWMPDAKQARVEKRDERKAASDAPVRFAALLVSDAVPGPGGGAVVVAEAYDAVYTTMISTSVVNGTVTTTYTLVFAGYAFRFGLVAAFDAAGAALWDHTVPLDPRLTKVLRPHVRLVRGEDGLVRVVYPYERRLHEVTLGDGRNPVGAPIAAQPEDSKPVQGDAAVWYRDTFLAWGVDRAGEGRTFWFEPLSP